MKRSWNPSSWCVRGFAARSPVTSNCRIRLSLELLEGRLCPTSVTVDSPGVPIPITGVVHKNDEITVTATLHLVQPFDTMEDTEGEPVKVLSSGGALLTFKGYGGASQQTFTATQDGETISAFIQGAESPPDEGAEVTAAVTTAKKHRFTDAQKAALTSTSQALRDHSLLAGTAGALLLVPEPVFSKAAGGLFLILAAAEQYEKNKIDDLIAKDPPDPNFMVVDQPVPPPVPTVTVGNGVTQAEADAFNALLANDAKGAALAVASLTAVNRADGALAAGNSFWETKQDQALATFKSQFQGVLQAESGLLTNVQNAVQAAGVSSQTIAASDVSSFQNDLLQNGLPKGMLDALNTMRADSATLDNMLQSLLAADPNVAAGTFPANLTDPAFLSALQGTIQALKASGPSTPGVFDPGTGNWYLRKENSGGAPDAGQFAYGGPGWIGVVGDWTGSGKTGIGVFNPSTGTWYLRNETSGGAPDAGVFPYGAPGWIPIVGDWTGSGKTGIGVFDPSTGNWYLRNESSGGAPDAGQFAFGAPGWAPVAGDWTGSGKTGIGVFNPSTGNWYLRNESSGGAPDAGQFAFGAPGWAPVVGNWTASGKTGIGVFDPGTGNWYLRNESSGGAPDAGQFAYGAPGWQPLAGNFQTASSTASPAAHADPLSSDALDQAFVTSL